MSTNPLIPPVLECLRLRPQGLTEYELLKVVEAALPALSDEAGLALFQKHFLVMNALYQLQGQLWDEGLWLSISPLSITIAPLPAAASEGELQTGNADPLRDYYLDWSQFERTGSAEVETLLTGFWRRFHTTGATELATACALLDLAPNADWDDIRASYRRLARASHPDRGGDPARFLEVRAAYERLARHWGK